MPSRAMSHKRQGATIRVESRRPADAAVSDRVGEVKNNRSGFSADHCRHRVLLHGEKYVDELRRFRVPFCPPSSLSRWKRAYALRRLPDRSRRENSTPPGLTVW